MGTEAVAATLPASIVVESLLEPPLPSPISPVPASSKRPLDDAVDDQSILSTSPPCKKACYVAGSDLFADDASTKAPSTSAPSVGDHEVWDTASELSADLFDGLGMPTAMDDGVDAASYVAPRLESALSIRTGCCAKRPRANDFTLCVACEVQARAIAQKLCTGCGGTLNMARRHAKRMGPQHEAALRNLVKIGGPTLRAALEKFSSECCGFGRGTRLRPFNWLQYSMSVQHSSELANMNDLVWMTKFYYAKVQFDHHGTPQDQSFTDFADLMATTPADRKSSCGTMLLLPEKSFVRASAARRQVEEVRMEHKREKDPRPEDFGAACSNLGKDHHSFRNPVWATALGIQPSSCDQLPDGAFSSKSTMVEQQQLAREAQDAEVARKAAEKAAREAKNHTRPYEPTAILGSLRPIWRDKSTRLCQKLLETATEASKVVDQVNADRALADNISDALAALTGRRDMLRVMMGTGQTLEDADEAWRAFVESSEVRTAPEGEPHPNLAALFSFQRGHHLMTTLVASSWEEHQALKDKLEDTLKLFTEVNAHVRGQIARVRSLIQRHVKQQARDQAKADKKRNTNAENAVRTRVTAAAKAKASAAAQFVAANSPLECSVLDVVTAESRFQNIHKVKVAKMWSPTGEEALHPALLTFTEPVVSESFHAGVTTFMEKFAASPLYDTARRASEMLRGDPKGWPACPVSLPDNEVRSFLTPTDQHYLDAPWHFGAQVNSQCMGPEHLSMASVKLQLRGERLALMFQYSAVATFVKAGGATGQTLTLRGILEFVKDASADVLGAMAQECPMAACTVSPGQGLYVPWGWFVLEKACNADNAGVRWTKFSNQPSPSFIELVSCMLPASRKDVKPNSAMAITCKVVTAVNQCASDEARRHMTSRIKQEFISCADGPAATASPAASSSNGRGSKRGAPGAKAEAAASSEPAAKQAKGGGSVSV